MRKIPFLLTFCPPKELKKEKNYARTDSARSRSAQHYQEMNKEFLSRSGIYWRGSLTLPDQVRTDPARSSLLGFNREMNTPPGNRARRPCSAALSGGPARLGLPDHLPRNPARHHPPYFYPVIGGGSSLEDDVVRWRDVCFLT
ncbi:hypothetical protein Dimus_022378, partial [Dionaea muscipula]